MSRLSWNEIQDRAAEFAAKWQGETYEKGESQSFWSDFLSVYGIDRKRHGAFFEYAIKKNGGGQGFIDMFWPGKLLAEQKSAGRDLGAANTQAFDYLHNMPDHDLPQFIVVSDFKTFQLINPENREKVEFTLENFPKHVKLFAFLVDEQSKHIAEENPVNRKAAEAMARLHNELRDNNYNGHDLELMLVRLVFCMFADDAGIFERGIFEGFIKGRTNIDGSDLGPRLVKIFEVLNTQPAQRQTTLDEDLTRFEYINGGLFAEPIRMPDFTYKMREELLKAMELDWSHVSPAIFGSMFQGVMDEKERRNLGAHYTSEKNILRVIKPLFLDDLYDEFGRVRRSKAKLAEFHNKLASLKFLDPACGCGNFLVITYRELRRLEHKVLEVLYGKNVGLVDIGEHGIVKVNVDQMFGIEIEEFPALIAQTALWLTDHQMNVEFSRESGQTFKRLPLTTSATILQGNALDHDWQELFGDKSINYIFGNPPFIGSKFMTQQMREELQCQFGNSNKTGTLDYVTGWYAQAAMFINLHPNVQAAFVSTNSITQGEQVAVFWSWMLDRDMEINFAHRTFKWSNDAKGIAGVYCVIIGFSFVSARPKPKRIFDYPDIKGDPTEQTVKHINPYLVDAPDILIGSRGKPICDVPAIGIGNKPIDGGNYLFTPDEKAVFLAKEPRAEKLFRRWVGAQEFINGIERWCLFVDSGLASELNAMPYVKERIGNVVQLRRQSRSEATRSLADFPTRFHVQNVPESDYIVIPKVSSERRRYIPIGLLGADTLASDLLFILPDANLYPFGILTSQMHMAWVRAVCGRLESRYRYSKDIVYNNFIWPEQVSDERRANIEQLAQDVLDARAAHPDATLADLYDPLTMPPDLLRAHRTLDRAVDKLYRPEPFPDDPARTAYLFQKYQEYTTEE